MLSHLLKNKSLKGLIILVLVLFALQSKQNFQIFKEVSADSYRYITFPNNKVASDTGWTYTSVSGTVPTGTTSGNVTVSTTKGSSNTTPFLLESNAIPVLTNEATSYSTSFSGVISTNTIWSSNILITGDVTVNSGVTLTINPGVTVFFKANSDDRSSGQLPGKSEILVFGTLTAVGTQSNPIYFTSDASTKATSDWGGVTIRKGSTTSLLNFVVLRYSENGLFFWNNDEQATNNIGGTVQNSYFSNNTNGIYLYPGMAGAHWSCVGTATSVVTIKNNLIENNLYGISISTDTGCGVSNDASTVQSNTIQNNGHGIKLATSTWWLGHSHLQTTIRANKIINNTTAGIVDYTNGSSDSSGSDSNMLPTIENNLFDGNPINIHLNLDPKGNDGGQTNNPTIRYNTIINSQSGIYIEHTQSYDTMNPTISNNVFYNNSSFDINNTTIRTITADSNFWGNTPTMWDAGRQSGNTNGTVVATTFLDSNSAPMISLISPSTAIAGESFTIYGAIVDTYNPHKILLTDNFAIKDNMSRLQVGQPSDHNISIGTINGITKPSDTLKIYFDNSTFAFKFNALSVDDIDLLSGGVNRDLATLPSADTWGVAINSIGNSITFTAPSSGTGYILAGQDINILVGQNTSHQALGDKRISNPDSVAEYEISFDIQNGDGTDNEIGEVEVPIVDDDTVTISGYLDTVLTFDIDTTTVTGNTIGAGDCDTAGGTDPCDSYAGAGDNLGYVVSVGEMTTNTVSKSNQTLAKHIDGNTGLINSIYFDLETNAKDGAVVTVLSRYGGLYLNPENIISSSENNVSSEFEIKEGSGRYGLQSLAGTHFRTNKVGTINIAEDCDGELNGDGGVDGEYYCGVSSLEPTEIFNTNFEPATEARVEFGLGVAPSSTNATGTYEDYLTFVATGTF